MTSHDISVLSPRASYARFYQLGLFSDCLRWKSYNARFSTDKTAQSLSKKQHGFQLTAAGLKDIIKKSLFEKGYTVTRYFAVKRLLFTAYILF